MAKKASGQTKEPASKKGKGKLIVIDGVDGSGKATQVKRLAEALRAKGKKVETIDFPRYKDNFFGAMIGECLCGDYGDFAKLDPHIASVLYACDRMESSKQIKEWLAAGKIVIADRFVSANQIHQGGKCKTEAERKEFLRWLDRMEHEVLDTPRPDVILYLNIPIAVSQELLAKQKASGIVEKKPYMKEKNGQKTTKTNVVNTTSATDSAKGQQTSAVNAPKNERQDQIELNLEYMEDSRRSALKIVRQLNNWKKIECYQRGKLLPIEGVHELIIKELKGVI